MNIEKALHILNLTKEYDNVQLKKAYYKQARKFHPDKNKCGNSKQMFQDINESYIFLLEKKKCDIDNDYLSIFLTSLFGEKIFPFKNKDQLITFLLSGVYISNDFIKKYGEDNIIYIYNILRKYGHLFGIDQSIIKNIGDKINEFNNDKNTFVYILEPNIDNLLDNEIYVLEHGEYDNKEKISVPLWHSDMLYEYDNNKIYVKCIPILNDNITIDDCNNIHIHIEDTINNVYVNKGLTFNIGNKKKFINSNKLYIKEYQRYIFKNEGISLINNDDIFKITDLGDIICYIKLI